MTESYNSTAKVIVLRTMLSDAAAAELIEKKKTSAFSSLRSRPKKETINLQEIKLMYECIRTVSGRYVADYLRHKVHTITVDRSVNEVIIGDARFERKTESKFKKMLNPRQGSNKIDIALEEHVFVDQSKEITIDSGGNEVSRSKHKINQDTMEVHPSKVLEDAENVIGPSMEREDAVARLEESMKGAIEPDSADLVEQFELNEIIELYVPIYEARITGPDSKVVTMRIDAARKKVV